MDLETQVGQLFVFVMRDSSERMHPHDWAFLKRFRPGGLIVYPRHVQSRHQIAGYLSELQGAALELGVPGPLIVCVDHRGGDQAILAPDAGGLEFPAPMAQAAITTDHERAGQEIGGALARDGLDVGFNLNLAPYGDFLENKDIQRFVFGNSMMGADPHVNAALSVGLIRGMRAEGMGTTYCVFPGGYGSSDRDPHHFAGIIAGSRQELDRHLIAPRAALATGVDAVMLSHFQYPALDAASQPATFSKPIIQGLLRGELGYQGLVITDDIAMRGAVDVAGSSGEAAVRAIAAGADLVLCAGCAGWQERNAVVEAVRQGRISARRMEDAVERVLALKARLVRGVPAARRVPDPVDAGRMAYWMERSLTWYKPPTPDGGIAARPARRTVAAARWVHFLDAAVHVGGRVVEPVLLPWQNELAQEAGADDRARILASTAVGDRVLFGTGSVGDLCLAQELARAGREVWVAHAGRVFQVLRTPDIPVVLLTYSHGPTVSRKAVEVFYGLSQARGRTPVDLPV